MKTSLLILSTLRKRLSLDVAFDELNESFSTKLIKIKIDKNISLHHLLLKYSSDSYDHILLDLPHTFLRNNAKTIKRISRKTTIYEEDACQNYIPDSRWFADFSYFHKKIGNTKIACTGYNITQKLKSEGTNAHFIPKGYDQNLISSLKNPRDIKLGFIGTYRSNTYHERYKMLHQVELFADLQIIRTNPGKEYNDTLNRINTFFSADCGIGEYMAKNFEAMGAGCLLIAYKQGNEEEKALNLIDRNNILLYQSFDEAMEKIEWARANTEEASAIAYNGTLLAQKEYSFETLAKKLAYVILN